MKLLLIALLVIFIIFNKKIIEPIIPDNCCGGMKLKRDYKETDINPPVKYRRCFKPVFINGNVDGYKGWDTMPCTTDTDSACCGGEARCRPSKYGGVCKKEDGDDFIYETSDGSKVKYDKKIHDIRVVHNTDNNDINFTQISNNMDIGNILIIFSISSLLLIGVYLFYTNNSIIKGFNPFTKISE